MNFDWQTAVALLIVAVAVVLLLRRLLRTGQPGCGSCEFAARPGGKSEGDLIQLTDKTNRSEK
ncbi:hypothetical protein [Rubinisphaera margarita]|uniref:hypothetical protein n=1 Tax=Rubinisphaera margarita TaxID=2909586 RepID=UPI001EE7F509|nr:hypothetical protein [Rubinisphaera margarita]MCG6154799.1 hypothetical protein [Rubinisphaera margarita]